MSIITREKTGYSTEAYQLFLARLQLRLSELVKTNPLEVRLFILFLTIQRLLVCSCLSIFFHARIATIENAFHVTRRGEPSCLFLLYSNLTLDFELGCLLTGLPFFILDSLSLFPPLKKNVPAHFDAFEHTHWHAPASV